MIPFVIMGFIMKPLQLKGAHLSCIFVIILVLSISKLLVDPGFVQAESKKAVAPETVVSKVQGNFVMN